MIETDTAGRVARYVKHAECLALHGKLSFTMVGDIEQLDIRRDFFIGSQAKHRGVGGVLNPVRISRVEINCGESTKPGAKNTPSKKCHNPQQMVLDR